MFSEDELAILFRPFFSAVRHFGKKSFRIQVTNSKAVELTGLSKWILVFALFLVGIVLIYYVLIVISGSFVQYFS